MDRMNKTQTIGDTHIGWPTIFPDVPEFLSHALSFFADMSRDASQKAANSNYIGNRDIAQGHAYAFNAAAEWIAEDLVRGMYYGDGNALVWTERR